MFHPLAFVRIEHDLGCVQEENATISKALNLCASRKFCSIDTVNFCAKGMDTIHPDFRLEAGNELYIKASSGDSFPVPPYEISKGEKTSFRVSCSATDSSRNIEGASFAFTIVENC